MRSKLGRSKEQYRVLWLKARKLRENGRSYKEIVDNLNISKSTVSRWCKDITLTKKQISVLGKRYDTKLRGAKANQLKREKEIEIIKKFAEKEIKKPDKDAFKMAGAMLYWAEGNKTNHLGITNSNPKLILFMIKWLKTFFGIKEYQLKASLNLHAGQNEKKIIHYWSRLTGIPEGRFGKSYIKPEGTGHRKKILYNGTIRISIYNKDLLYRVLFWIDRYAEFITGR